MASSQHNNFSLYNEIVPTTILPAGQQGQPFKRRPIDISQIVFTGYKKKIIKVSDWLTETRTDSFIVVHNGQIIFENYWNGHTEKTRHLLFSIGSSLVGTLASKLAAEKKIQPDEKIIKYIPELKKTGFANHTVRDLMDMHLNRLDYNEDYENKKSDFYKYISTLTHSRNSISDKNSLRKFLIEIKESRPKSEPFSPITPAVDVLTWVIERATGRKISDLLTESFWLPAGTDSDAYVLVDAVGISPWGVGLNATLKDCARLGQALLQNTNITGKKLLPSEVLREIRSGGDREAFAQSKYSQYLPDFSYKSHWWVSHNSYGAFMSIGIYGQWLYINPFANTVIVKFSSDTEAASPKNIYNSFLAMHEISTFLLQKK